MSVPFPCIFFCIFALYTSYAPRPHNKANLCCTLYNGVETSALCGAVLHDEEEAAREAIKKGANVNYQSRHGTPLHRAASNQNEAMATLLIEHGAIVDARDEDGQTPFACGANYPSQERAILPAARTTLQQGGSILPAAQTTRTRPY